MYLLDLRVMHWTSQRSGESTPVVQGRLYHHLAILAVDHRVAVRGYGVTHALHLRIDLLLTPYPLAKLFDKRFDMLRIFSLVKGVHTDRKRHLGQ